VTPGVYTIQKGVRIPINTLYSKKAAEVMVVVSTNLLFQTSLSHGPNGVEKMAINALGRTAR
jgi:hypothetical protein